MGNLADHTIELDRSFIMNENGHVRLRKGLLDHINSGKMKADMLSVYTYLLLEADYTCGIVWHTSAPYIGMKFRKQATHINRQLIKLEKNGYIKRFGHRGQISAYEILINKYLLFNGVLINTDNSSDINNIAWQPNVNGELIGSYRELKVNLIDFYVSSYKEVKNIIIKEVKNKEVKKALWRESFEEYLKLVNKAFEEIINDVSEMEKQQSFYPNVDIKKSIEKLIHNFWGTEAGWKNKKGKKTKSINMKMTLLNNIDKNRVWKAKEEKKPEDKTDWDVVFGGNK